MVSAADLRRGPLIAENNWHFGDAQLARGLQAQMPVHDFAVAAGEYRDLEAKLANAAAHASTQRIIALTTRC
jgi:hypothetical protein